MYCSTLITLHLGLHVSSHYGWHFGTHSHFGSHLAWHLDLHLSLSWHSVNVAYKIQASIILLIAYPSSWVCSPQILNNFCSLTSHPNLLFPNLIDLTIFDSVIPLHLHHFLFLHLYSTSIPLTSHIFTQLYLQSSTIHFDRLSWLSPTVLIDFIFSTFPIF